MPRSGCRRGPAASTCRLPEHRCGSLGKSRPQTPWRSTRLRFPREWRRRPDRPWSRSPGRPGATRPAAGPFKSETTSPVRTDVAQRRPGAHQPAVGRQGHHLALVFQMVGLGQDDLGLVAPGNRVVVAGPDLLDRVAFDDVIGSEPGQDQESPGLAARPDASRLVAANQQIVRAVAPRRRVRSSYQVACRGSRCRRSATVRRRTRSFRRAGCCLRSRRSWLDPASSAAANRPSPPGSRSRGISRSRCLNTTLNFGSSCPWSKLSVMPITAGPQLIVVVPADRAFESHGETGERRVAAMDLDGRRPGCFARRPGRKRASLRPRTSRRTGRLSTSGRFSRYVPGASGDRSESIDQVLKVIARLGGGMRGFGPARPLGRVAASARENCTIELRPSAAMSLSVIVLLLSSR